MNPRDVRVVVMGSPAFAVPSLRALARAGYNVVAAVSQPDRPAGRGGAPRAPDVKLAAIHLGIEIFQPETVKDEAAQARLRAFNADVFVVAAYGKILPRAVLAMPSRGSLNVHASLLPRWRGASPISAAILAGDEETGVSIMEVVPKMDAGDVVLSCALRIERDDTTGSLEPRLADLGARALIEALPGWYQRELTPEPQDDGLATHCQLLKKEDGHLRADLTVAEAERAVRAYNPWPGAFVGYEGQRLSVWKARPHPATPSPQIVGEGKVRLDPGSLVVVEKEPGIVVNDGTLVLEEVQREGGKRLSGRDFVNGLRGHLAERVEMA